jgi:hypothetical protein
MNADDNRVVQIKFDLIIPNGMTTERIEQLAIDLQNIINENERRKEFVVGYEVEDITNNIFNQ